MKKQEHIDWNRPKGRWCMVSACTLCGRFCRDTAHESMFSRAKWGQSIGAPARTNGWWLDKDGMCNECRSIRYCDLCEKEGNAKTIYQRNDVWSWNFDGPKDYTTKSKSCLCMSCWNKVRAVVRRQDKADELQQEINKLNRSIKDERRNRRAS